MVIREPQFREIAHFVIDTDNRKVASVVHEICQYVAGQSPA
jgi:shikimate kinase